MPQQTAHYLKDYRAPEYLVPHIRLNFDVYDDHTAVTAELSIQPQPDAGGTLVLQGSAELVSLELNDQRLPETANRITPLPYPSPIRGHTRQRARGCRC